MSSRSRHRQGLTLQQMSLPTLATMWPRGCHLMSHTVELVGDRPRGGGITGLTEDKDIG